MSDRWAVVIPTNRPEQFRLWSQAWRPLLRNHDVTVFACEDLDDPDIGAEAGVTILRRGS